MSAPSTFSPFVSVKFDAVGRAHQFLLPEVDFEPPIHPGDEVVVASGERESYGRVIPSVPNSMSGAGRKEHRATALFAVRRKRM